LQLSLLMMLFLLVRQFLIFAAEIALLVAVDVAARNTVAILAQFDILIITFFAVNTCAFAVVATPMLWWLQKGFL